LISAFGGEIPMSNGTSSNLIGRKPGEPPGGPIEMRRKSRSSRSARSISKLTSVVQLVEPVR
jgi:hypothetical protein